MNDSNNGQVEALERIIRTAIESGADTDNKFAIVPANYTVRGLEEFENQPSRVKASPDHETVESFIQYANRWKASGSSIYCNQTGRKLVAVLDDHVGATEPSWRTHKSSYQAKLSRELVYWQKFDRQDLTQIAFAELLEERLVDVESPPGATLLELALNLQSIQGVTFRSAIRLNTGMVRMEYAEENGNGNVELPDKIGLAIPLFHNGDLYKVLARLRFRVKDGKATFRYQLVEIEDKLEHAFAKIVERVAAEVPSINIYQGTL